MSIQYSALGFEPTAFQTLDQGSCPMIFIFSLHQLMKDKYMKEVIACVVFEP